MLNEIVPDVYQIGVPLAGTPLKMTNAYLIKSREGRHLLIDNGFNQPEARRSLQEDLESLDVPLEELDFFITHVHSDHNGLTAALCRSAESKVWGSRVDSALILNSALAPQKSDSLLGLNEHWEKEFLYMEKNGISRREMEELLLNHPARAYGLDGPVHFSIAGEGDILEYGRFKLRVISVPGHSPDQIGLYEDKEKIFFAGDHILGNITPNIAAWGSRFDYLGQYLQSLDKVADMDIALTLPGHRVIIQDTGKRIAELKQHHADRLNEVRAILKKADAPLTAYAVATQMHWSLKYASWQEFPVPQKWFAAGEASTHLVHLEGLGELNVEDTGALYLYSCK
jgi:glyoxylase-like metal-dependent hydrolase (beta-lactamase superfamily II)